jgi:hypothetical protein
MADNLFRVVPRKMFGFAEDFFDKVKQIPRSSAISYDGYNQKDITKE